MHIWSYVTDRSGDCTIQVYAEHNFANNAHERRHYAIISPKGIMGLCYWTVPGHILCLWLFSSQPVSQGDRETERDTETSHLFQPNQPDHPETRVRGGFILMRHAVTILATPIRSSCHQPALMRVHFHIEARIGTLIWPLPQGGSGNNDNSISTAPKHLCKGWHQGNGQHRPGEQVAYSTG